LIVGALLLLVFFVDNTCLDPLDLFVTGPLSQLDLLDEVVGFENGPVRLGHHDVTANSFLVRNDLSGDSVTDVNDAVFVRFHVVVEENVLRGIVGLVDQ
jgi:hypothetical protein